jgi:HEAT repeat protein
LLLNYFALDFRVRHEAAESLGAFANTATEEVLKEFTQDADPIVAHSCVVALDVLEHEKKGIPYFAGVTSEVVVQ